MAKKDTYAVIKIKGQQFRVSEGEEILVGKLSEKEKPEAEVLLVKTEKAVKVGKPTVKTAKVALKVVDQEVKGKKLHVQTYKAKSRHRRKIGFRPRFTKIKIGKISA